MKNIPKARELSDAAVHLHRLRRVCYQPLPSQRKLHSAIRASFKGFSGPIGSGKSAAMAYETIACAALNPGCIGLVGAPTFPMLRDGRNARCSIPWRPSALITPLISPKNILTFPDNSVFEGAQILFRSMDNYERIRGANLAWFGVDELTYCKEEAWLRLVGRLRDSRGKAAYRLCLLDTQGFRLALRAFHQGRPRRPGELLGRIGQSRREHSSTGGLLFHPRQEL